VARRIQEFCPNTKILLVGCKSDLRTDLTTLVELSNHRQTPVSYDQVRCQPSNRWTFHNFSSNLTIAQLLKHSSNNKELERALFTLSEQAGLIVLPVIMINQHDGRNIISDI